jgi:hypothetical protein
MGTGSRAPHSASFLSRTLHLNADAPAAFGRLDRLRLLVARVFAFALMLSCGLASAQRAVPVRLSDAGVRGVT